MKPVKKLSFTSLMAAFALILLFAAGFLSTLSITLAVFAGLLVAVVFVECGRTYAFLCYLTDAILSFLFVTDKSVALMYLLMFGLYPIFKSFAESARTVVFEYALKFLFCNAMLALLYFLVQAFAALPVFPDIPFVYPIALVFLNAAFFIYDLGFSKLVSLYRHFRSRKK